MFVAISFLSSSVRGETSFRPAVLSGMPDPGNMLEKYIAIFLACASGFFYKKLLSDIILGSISKVYSLHSSSPMTSMSR